MTTLPRGRERGGPVRPGETSKTIALAILALAACGPKPKKGPWLEQTSVLVSGHSIGNSDCRSDICRHNENTDLYVWQGAVWLVHRTAMSQILGPNSSLRVSRSDDGGRSFSLAAVIPAPIDRDLRDPHFFTVGNELWIEAITRLPVISSRDSDVASISVTTHSTDGTTWSPLAPAAPQTWSFWRAREHGGSWYTAAYEDGDKSVVLFSSSDGATWTQGATIYDVAADTPLETELVFMPSGRLLALVRMDGTDEELLGEKGRLRTRICWASPPYATFDCPQEFSGARLDGPVAFLWKGRLFVVARKHLGADGRKRTALFEIGGTLEGGPLTLREIGEVPSAGDTAYAGVASLDADRVLVSWYSGDVPADDDWFTGMLALTDIWTGRIDLANVP
jgi:hypothetical protein